jgi:molybdopterin synthase sulfur carrier subunit
MACTVHVGSPLRQYTGGAATVSAEGATLEQILTDLDRRFPGMRFRMIDEQQRVRSHIRIFIGMHEAPDLQQAVKPQQPVHLLCALSGG